MTSESIDVPLDGPVGREVAQAAPGLPELRCCDGIPQSWHNAMRLANRIYRTGFVGPFRGDAASVLACILAGQDLGIGPTIAFNSFHLIQGRASLKPEAMRGLVLRAGHTINVVESTTDHVTLHGRRRDNSAEATVTWSIEDAERAELLGNPSWMKYPRAMLLARATSELCRQIFPDTIGGYYTDEELEAISATSYDASDEALPDPVSTVAALPVVDPPVAAPAGPEFVPDERPHDDGLARRIHADIARTFPGATQLERDRVRHAFCIAVTRGRPGGPVKSSNDLDEAEQLELSERLVRVRSGDVHVTVGQSGPVVVKAGAKMYTITIDPPRVVESEQLTLDVDGDGA